LALGRPVKSKIHTDTFKQDVGLPVMIQDLQNLPVKIYCVEFWLKV